MKMNANYMRKFFCNDRKFCILNYIELHMCTHTCIPKQEKEKEKSIGFMKGENWIKSVNSNINVNFLNLIVYYSCVRCHHWEGGWRVNETHTIFATFCEPIFISKLKSVFKKWTKNSNTHFSKYTQIANKDLTKSSKSLVIRKMQIQPQWDAITHALVWLKLERITMTCIASMWKLLDLSYIAGSIAFGKQFGDFI